MDWKVGEEVVVTDVNVKGPKNSVVTKVGRKFVYADGIRFDANTGRSADAYGHQKLWKCKMYDDYATASNFMRELRRMMNGRRPAVDASALRRLLSDVHALVMKAGAEIGEWP